MIAAYAISGLCGALGGLALLARSGVSSTFAGRGRVRRARGRRARGDDLRGRARRHRRHHGGLLVLMVAFNLVNIVGLDYNAQLIVKGIIIIADASCTQLKVQR